MTQNYPRRHYRGVHPDKGWATIAHSPALAQLPEFRLTAISHNRPDVAKAAAEKYGVPHALGSADELIGHPEVDLVVISVKVTHHRELVEKAVAAGKAVFSEWPLGMNLADATAMRDLDPRQGCRDQHRPADARRPGPLPISKDLLSPKVISAKCSSATMVGSGITFGESMPGETFAYTLSIPRRASACRVSPSAHSIERADRYARKPLRNGDRQSRHAAQDHPHRGNRRDPADEPFPIPLVVSGTLENGTVVAAHFRGGLSRGTNFRIEINGTKGDLILTSPVGYVGIGGFTR